MKTSSDTKGFVSEFHDCMVHKPVSKKQATKILDVQAAVDKEWKTFGESACLGLGKGNSQSSDDQARSER